MKNELVKNVVRRYLILIISLKEEEEVGQEEQLEQEVAISFLEVCTHDVLNERGKYIQTVGIMFI